MSNNNLTELINRAQYTTDNFIIINDMSQYNDKIVQYRPHPKLVKVYCVDDVETENLAYNNAVQCRMRLNKDQNNLKCLDDEVIKSFISGQQSNIDESHSKNNRCYLVIDITQFPIIYSFVGFDNIDFNKSEITKHMKCILDVYNMKHELPVMIVNQCISWTDVSLASVMREDNTS